jgi:transposase
MAAGGEAVEDYRRRSWRSWPLERKLAILEELATSGDALAEVARRHGMNANHLLTWRSRARAGTLAGQRGPKPAPGREVGFVQAGVVGAGAPARPAVSAGSAPGERIEVEFAGGAVVRFGETVDPGRLHGVLLAVRSAL